MRDLKYIATGLGIGVLLFCFIAAGLFLFSPLSQTTELPLPEFLNTKTPLSLFSETQLPNINDTAISPAVAVPAIPTQIPASPGIDLPTSTPSPVEVALLKGDLVIQGPLSAEGQIRLYETSLTFIAPTARESKAIGERINGKGYGSPTLICGPLSIAILREAGLINPSIIPYDFWLLNPDIPEDRKVIDRTFPPSKYEETRHKIRLDKFDWKAHPLLPGDFLYIYRGPGGNFDHILVVNRVDSGGRAYAVTNYGTPEGFIINEVMLYDPDNPLMGIFQTWTEKENAMLGSTGFDGFQIWRRIPPGP